VTESFIKMNVQVQTQKRNEKNLQLKTQPCKVDSFTHKIRLFEEMKALDISLPPLPDIGVPKFRLPLPSIDYSMLTTKALF